MNVPAAQQQPPTLPKISVVVPVYKVEKFIAECLESILAQDFNAFEVIAVDDGSPDSSGAICDDFAHRDPRITVVHKENGGPAAARKTGVEHARGEWICLIDSDDILLPHALATLFAASQKFPEADIIEGFYVEFNEPAELRDLSALGGNGRLCGPNGSRKPVVFDAVTYAKRLFGGDFFFVPTPWSKLIRRRALLDSHAFDVPREMILHEDMVMCLRAATESRSVVRIFAPVSAVRNNPMGTTRNRATSRRPMTYWLMAWNETRRSGEGRSETWQIVWKTAVTEGLFRRFLGNPDFSLREPRLRALLAELAPTRTAMPPRQQKQLALVLLGTKFPFSVLPECFVSLFIKFPLRTRVALKRALLKKKR